MDAIEAYELCKRIGGRVVLDKLNLQVPENASCACVGLKGSGKTTLVRILAGLSRPSSGECFVGGYVPFFEASRLHAVAGVMLKSAGLYRSRSLQDNLYFFAEINGVEKNDSIDRSSFLLHRLGIWEQRDALVRDVPTGVLCRASLARALVHSPKILLLDEPSAGMDRETVESMQAMLRYLVREEGVTLLLCSEDSSFAQSVCDSFFLLKDGYFLAKGSAEELRSSAGVKRRAVIRMAEEEPGPEGFSPTEDGCWQAELESMEELGAVITRTVSAGGTLLEARLEEPTLEEIFAAHMAGGSYRTGEWNGQSGQGRDETPGDTGETGEPPSEADQELQREEGEGGEPA